MEATASEVPSRQVRIIEPVEGCEHTHTVILLHGRDSNCDDFSDEFFESEISEDLAEVLSRENTARTEKPTRPRTLQALFPTLRWVFPTAPAIQSERFGVPLTQWFDMWSVEEPGERPEMQEPGLRRSVGFVAKIVADESRSAPRERLYLGGISQGFATAVAAYLADGQGLAGLIGFSSWANPTLATHGFQCLDGEHFPGSGLRAREGSKFTLEGVMTATPVFLAHAVDDDVVPIRNGRILRDALRIAIGSKVEWHEYQHGGHWITEPEGVDDFVQFLRRTMT